MHNPRNWVFIPFWGEAHPWSVNTQSEGVHATLGICTLNPGVHMPSLCLAPYFRVCAHPRWGCTCLAHPMALLFLDFDYLLAKSCVLLEHGMVCNFICTIWSRLNVIRLSNKVLPCFLEMEAWVFYIEEISSKEMGGFGRIRHHTTRFTERKCFLEKDALGFGDLLKNTNELEHQRSSSLSFL